MSNLTIVSCVVLAERLGARLDRLKDMVRCKESLYQPFEQRRRSKIRQIDRPVDPLKAIQRRIHKLFLRDYLFQDCVHAGRMHRSIFGAASPHVDRPVVVTVDIQRFFGSIFQNAVYRVWRDELGFGRDVAKLLTDLTTYHGYLPQGAPTSVALANLVMAPADLEIAMRLSLMGPSIRYTRWVDDLIISGSIGEPLDVIEMVAQAIRPLHLKVNRSKARKGIMRHNRRQAALGLVLNQKLTIAREKRSNLRAAVHNCTTFRKVTVRSIMGRLEFLKSCHPATAKTMLCRLQRQIDRSRRAIC